MLPKDGNLTYAAIRFKSWRKTLVGATHSAPAAGIVVAGAARSYGKTDSWQNALRFSAHRTLASVYNARILENSSEQAMRTIELLRVPQG